MKPSAHWQGSQGLRSKASGEENTVMASNGPRRPRLAVLHGHLLQSGTAGLQGAWRGQRLPSLTATLPQRAWARATLSAAAPETLAMTKVLGAASGMPRNHSSTSGVVKVGEGPPPCSLTSPGDEGHPLPPHPRHQSFRLTLGTSNTADWISPASNNTHHLP